MKLSKLTIKTKKENKIIIDELTVEIKKGELFGILGPSGCGKTTLLDFMTGNVNSKLVYEGLLETRGCIKYVSQEENLHGFYTVRQYLDFYITLNYGFTVSDETRQNIITKIAEDCGLISCIDVVVGDVFKKGLSGGQKRRLTIALELVSRPSVLILDEPTSGLDSCSAFRVMELLQRLTQEGITVVCTIHQPSSEIWSLIDKIMLLSRGQLCYTGDTKGAVHFFASVGQHLPKQYNPADFFITLINDDFDPTIDPKKIRSEFIRWYDLPKDLVEMKKEAGAISNSRQAVMGIKTKANTFTKFLAVLKRATVNLVKNPGIIGVRLAMYLMLSFMIGVMFLNLGDHTNHKDVVSRTTLLFYVNAFLVFMSIAVLPFFLMERSIIRKEVYNNLYQPFHYQLSMFLTSLLGVFTIAIFSTILVVLLAKLNGFGIFLLILFLSLVVAESLTRLVSLLVPHYIIGMALVAGLYGMNMLCEGFMILKQDIPGWFIWGHYMAFHTYAYQAFMYNEFHSISSITSGQFANGVDVLEFYSMRTTKIWKDVIILISFSIFFEICSYVVMQIKYQKKTIPARKVLPLNENE